MLLTALTMLGCTLPPSPADIRQDMELRRARRELPAGDCWMKEAILAGEDARACVPGPWLRSEEEFYRWVGHVEDAHDRFPPDELFLIGLATVHSGGSVEMMGGTVWMGAALRRGVSPELLASTRPYMDDGSLLRDSVVYGTGQVVLDFGWRERLAWARLRDELDREPARSLEEIEQAMLEYGDTERVILPNMARYEDVRQQVNALWLAALPGAAEGPSTREPTPEAAPTPHARQRPDRR